MLNLESVPVAFNMTLANGDTSRRYCVAAASLLGQESDAEDPTFPWTLVGDEIDLWNAELFRAGYCAIWNAGDVVVFDLRQLTDDEREEFYRATESW